MYKKVFIFAFLMISLMYADDEIPEYKDIREAFQTVSPITGEGFYFTKTVEVLSDQGRMPIEGAKVSIYYQRNTGVGYIQTPPIYTNSFGRVNISAINTEPNVNLVDRNYRIDVDYLGKTGSFSATYGSSEDKELIQIILQGVEMTSIKFINELGQEIQGASINIKEAKLNLKTNNKGEINVLLPSNEYDLEIEHRGIIYNEKVRIQAGVDRIIRLEKYDFYTDVFDCFGDKMYGVTVTLEDRIKHVKIDEPILFSNITKRYVDVIYEIGDISKRVSYDLRDVQGELQKIYLDRTPPSIEGIRANITNNIVIVWFYVNDPGPFSSDVERDKINVRYAYDGGTFFNAPVYVNMDEQGNYIYYTEILEIVEGSELGIRFEAEDRFKNKVIVTTAMDIPIRGYFASPDLYDDEDFGFIQIGEIKEEGIDFILVIGIVAFVAFIIGLFWFIKTKISEQEDY